jgi:hypothetical protein
LLNTEAFAGTDGSVLVAVYNDNRYLEFVVESNHLISLIYEIDKEEVFYEENLTLQEAKSKLGEFHWQWLGYESSVEPITPTRTTDSLAPPLVSQATGESQLSARNVSPLRGERYVSTSGNTTILL